MIESLKEIEFPQLNSGIFVDYGGSFPISQTQISTLENYFYDISSFYPNENDTIKIETEFNLFKNELLNLFNVSNEEYNIFFYNNTTMAIRSLVNSFPFSNKSMFIYQVDNHNSILGIRNIAIDKQTELLCVGSTNPKKTGEDHSLYSYPLQSNFNGKKYPLNWINEFQNLKPNFSHVLIDCAAYLPSCNLNLKEYPANFVVFSLYKLFGIHGGVLLIKKEIFNILNNLFIPPIDYLSIIGSKSGLEVKKSFENLFKISIEEHVYNLTLKFHEKLNSFKHENNILICETYPKEFKSIKEQGGVCTFNLRNIHNGPVHHEGIFISAISNNIFLRFGVHCNPGATYMALNWKPDDIRRATKDHEASCSLTASIMEGKHVGTVRVSFGYLSTEKELDELINFFESHFIDKIKKKKRK